MRKDQHQPAALGEVDVDVTEVGFQTLAGVVARLLAKDPARRYQSCREFIDAARMALGIFGRGTDSLTSGVTTSGLDASAPPG